MSARHKVTTVERGTDCDGKPGFAARCETCGGVTFGGFPSRTAARRALDGHEEALSDAAATAAEGEDQNTHESEQIMKIESTTVAPAAPEPCTTFGWCTVADHADQSRFHEHEHTVGSVSIRFGVGPDGPYVAAPVTTDDDMDARGLDALVEDMQQLRAAFGAFAAEVTPRTLRRPASVDDAFRAVADL